MSDVERFPLSRNQRALWWSWNTASNRSLYNTSSLFRVLSPHDVADLRRAFQHVIDRHGCFRTTLDRAQDGTMVQARHARWKAPFFVHDAAQWSEDELARALVRQHGAFCDLEHESSVELHLFRRSEADSVVLLRFHHLFHDHGSTDILHAELFEAYAAERAGTSPRWTPHAHDYDAYVADESSFLSSSALDDSLRFWGEALREQTAELELPTDLGSTTGPRVGATLTARLAGAEALVSFCRTHRVSRYRALLAAWVALLHRWSSMFDITVGTPVDCRGPKYANVGGYFANLLPFRFRVGRDMTFLDLARHVDEVVASSLLHRRVPFSMLVERFGGNPGESVTPFFRTSFALTKTDRCPLLNRPQMSTHLPWHGHIAGLDLATPPPVAQQEGHFDLSFWVWDLGVDGLACEVKYDANQFSTAAARRIVDHYEALLGAMLARPDAPIRTHAYLGAAERRSIESALSPRAPAAPFEPAHAGFERRAREAPERPALAHGDEVWSYGETDAWAEALAHRLAEHGVAPGDRVALLLPKKPAAVAAQLAVLKAGAAFVPIDTAYPRERITQLLGDAAPRVVVTDAPGAETAAIRADVIDIASVKIGPRLARRAVCEPESLAYVIFTSGSTGTPKGVMVPHRGIANLATALAEEWGLVATSRVFAFAPTSFDAFVADVYPALMRGALVHLGDDPFPTAGRYLAEFLARSAITHVTLPPSVWLSLPRVALPAVQVAVSAGEACPPEVVRRWGTDRPFFNNYGPTEITVCATTKRCATDERVTIGRPIPGIFAQVVDAYGEPVPVGVAGELCLGGVGLARGYLDRDELTRARFARGDDGRLVYRTGDVARLLATGDLEYLGRRDEQVKLRGIRIELGEVEEAARRLPGVVDAAAAVQSLGARPVLILYVVGRTEGVHEELRAMVPTHLVPAIVARIDEIPRGPTGKVDRQRLPTATTARARRVGPRDDVERSLFDIFRAVLGHDDFDVDDDFFAIGGDSLAAVDVLHRIESAYGAMPPDVLMRHATIRDLASLTRSTGRALREPVIELAAGASTREADWVFVHPAGGDLTAYRHLLRRLERTHRILGICVPPTGDSAHARAESVAELARAYASLVDDRSTRSIVLVGWSFGGVVAQAMSTHLRRLAGLVLLDSSPRIPEGIRIDTRALRHPIVTKDEALYRTHAPSAAPARAWVCRAAQGVCSPGAWNAWCSVESETTLPCSHDDLLRPPYVDAIVQWLEAFEEGGRQR